MRILIYGTLAFIALILGIDTHVGTRLTPSQTAALKESVDSLADCHLNRDARMADSILMTHRFRRSWFFDWLNNISKSHGGAFGFYAYTPVFARRVIFLGPNYWLQDAEGRASVTVHEMAHLRRHCRRFFRGLPRPADEATAYRYQYLTYPAIGLDAYGIGTDVYWDMMCGVRDYVIPEDPEYAKHTDVRQAIEAIKQSE